MAHRSVPLGTLSVTLAIALLMLLGGASLHTLNPVGHVSAGTAALLTNSTAAPAPFLSLAGATTAVANAYADDGVDTADVAPAAALGARIYSAYVNTSSSAAYSSLNATHGAQGFDFQVGGGSTTGVSDAEFGFHYLSGNQSVVKYWEVSLPSGVVSSEVTSSVEAGRASDNSVNWAGANSSVPGNKALASISTDQVWPASVTNKNWPLNVPSGDDVEQQFAVWDGLLSSNNTLLQAGFFTDVNHTNIANGTAWWELACLFSLCSGGGDWTQYVGMPHVNNSDDVTELVKWSGTPLVWDLTVKDYNYNHGGAGSFKEEVLNIAPWLSGGYHPTRGAEVVEEFTDGGLFQQAPGILNQVGFYDLSLCTTTSLGSCSYTYDDNISYVTSQLTQACYTWSGTHYMSTCTSVDTSLETIWSTGSGGYWDQAGYWYVNQLGNDYDYDYIMS